MSPRGMVFAWERVGFLLRQSIKQRLPHTSVASSMIVRYDRVSRTLVNSLIAEKDKTAAEKDKTAAEKDKTAAEKDKTAAALSMLLAEKDKLAAALSEATAEKEKMHALQLELMRKVSSSTRFGFHMPMHRGRVRN